MATFFDQASQKFNPAEENSKWFDTLAEEFPMLAAAINGIEKTVDNPALPPMTLMVFARDGVLKASLSSPEHNRSWFFTLKSASRILEAVEVAMAAGDGEWVNKRADRVDRNRR